MDVSTVRAEHIEAYLGREYRSAKRVGFSFSAFFLSFLWFFRRKMYGEFAAVLAAAVILPLIVGGIAGICKMEGEITPQTVYSELRRVPVEIYWENDVCIYGRCSDNFADTAWYEYMTAPLTSRWLKPDINSEPAFYFSLFRVITLLIIDLCCGIFGERLYMRHIRRKAAYQLRCIRTDNEDSRIGILKKAGNEYRELKPPLISVTVFFILFTVLPVFNDAVCIMYGT